MKAYSKYKDSKIKWIGKIPENWKVDKINRQFSSIGSGTTPKSGLDIYHKEGIVAWLNTGDLNDSYIVSTKKKLTQAALDDYSSLKLYPIGSVVIAMYGATIGKLGILKLECVTNQACCVISNGKDIDQKFLFYWLFNNKDHIISLGYGGGQPNISQDLVRQLPIQVPTLFEQNKIVSFLDRKTSNIDSIIARKNDLVARLSDYRQSLINEAVTQGITEKGKIRKKPKKFPAKGWKDSGVDWIGWIPEEWEIKRLRYLGTTQNGISAGAEYFGKGDPFISYKDVYSSESLDSSSDIKGLADSTAKDQLNYSINAGDVFFTRTSETIEEIGMASTCLTDFPKTVFAGFLIKFRPSSKRLTKEFSKFYFRSFVPNEFFVRRMNLVTRASLSQSLLKDLPVLLPSAKEQERIFNFLEKNTQTIDCLMEKIQVQVDKLDAYKKSLISEAVTGKIDLRDYETD